MRIADFHTATVHAGQSNEHAGNNALSSVSYDGRTDYYELDGMVSESEFRAFVAETWDADEMDLVAADLDVIEWGPGVFRVNL